MKTNSSPLSRSASLNGASTPAGPGEAKRQPRALARSASLPAQFAPLAGNVTPRSADSMRAKPTVTVAQAGSSALANQPSRSSKPLPPVPAAPGRLGTAGGMPHASGSSAAHVNASAAANALGTHPPRAGSGVHANGAAARPADLPGYGPAAGEAAGAGLGLAAGLAPASSAALNTASGAAWAAAGAGSFFTDHDNRPASVASKLSNTAAGVTDAVAAQTGKPSVALASGGLWGASAALNLGTAGYDAFKGNGRMATNVIKGTSALLNGAAAGLSMASTGVAGTAAAVPMSIASNAAWLTGAGVQAMGQYFGNRPRPADPEMGLTSHERPASPEHIGMSVMPPLQHPPAVHLAADDEPLPMPGAFPAV